MKKHVAKSKKKPSKSSNTSDKSDAEDLSLDLISQLGGEKADLELLNDLDPEEDEVVEVKEDLDADPVSRDEIRDLIAKLGFEKCRPEPDKGQENGVKVKLLKMPGVKEEPVEQGEISNKKTKNKFPVQSQEQSGGIKLEVDDFTWVTTPKTRNYLLLSAGGKWHENEFEHDPIPTDLPSKERLKKLQAFAKTLYDSEVALYKKQQEKKKSSDATWLRTVLTSGTFSDKIAALTVLIQESPVHTLTSLDTLVGMVKKKGRRQVNMAVDTLRELFLSDLLPDSRKLRTFDQHPFLTVTSLSSGNKDTRDRRLIYWLYEDLIKEHYGRFVEALRTLSHDTVALTKRKAVDAVFALLVAKPEQEKALLTMLVNKLGDPDHKLAAHTAHLLTRLVGSHPNMKMVILQEVERLLYRPNISPKARYYAVCFLNQLILSPKEKDVAARLITIYFSFFKASVKKKELDGKLLSGLLAGVHRAYPYAKVEQESLREQLTTLHQLLPSLNFNTAVQALTLLHHTAYASDSMCDSYYTSLYRKMLDPELMTSSKQALFLNLLFKSMKKDTSTKRIQSFVKRLLQLCCQMTPTFSCGALVLLSELLKVRPEILRISKKFEDVDEDEEEHFTDVKDEEDEKEEMVNGDSVPASPPAGTTPLTGTSWLHRSNTKDTEAPGHYDPAQRNPLHSRAELDCLWELERLGAHYHPSVALFAGTILKGQAISYPGNPLQDFTLIRFLDRFVYRNPKKKEQVAGSANVLQPGRYQPQGARAIAINTPEYLETEKDNVPADERFFYQYFQQKAAQKQAVEDMDSDADSVSDAEFDDYLGTYEKGLVGEANDEMEFDFASEMRKMKGKKGKDDDEASDEDDDDLNLSDEEVEFDDDDFKDEFDDDLDEGEGFDEENVDDDDMDDIDPFGVDFSSGGSKKRKKNLDLDDLDMPSKKKGKAGKSEDLGNLFAAAEEFAHLMDDTAGDGVDTTGTEAMANTDKASTKQLKWESDREKWMNKKNWKTKSRGRPGPKHKGPKHKGKGKKMTGKRR